ncbi:hypothetical protein [Flagellimonas lutimaris]|uniref:hypothetical protein n=1 Tax=Flagellimonas lutimaris TaxID=475082 RepID=UPI0039C1F973
MNDFRTELKRKCDPQFSSLKSRHRPKYAKKGSIQSVQNNLEAFGKLTEETNKMVTKTANEILSTMEVPQAEATKVAQDLMRSYLEQIKNSSGF